MSGMTDNTYTSWWDLSFMRHQPWVLILTCRQAIDIHQLQLHHTIYWHLPSPQYKKHGMSLHIVWPLDQSISHKSVVWWKGRTGEVSVATRDDKNEWQAQDSPRPMSSAYHKSPMQAILTDYNTILWVRVTYDERLDATWKLTGREKITWLSRFETWKRFVSLSTVGRTHMQDKMSFKLACFGVPEVWRCGLSHWWMVLIPEQKSMDKLRYYYDTDGTTIITYIHTYLPCMWRAKFTGIEVRKA